MTGLIRNDKVRIVRERRVSYDYDETYDNENGSS